MKIKNSKIQLFWVYFLPFFYNVGTGGISFIIVEKLLAASGGSVVTTGTLVASGVPYAISSWIAGQKMRYEDKYIWLKSCCLVLGIMSIGLIFAEKIVTLYAGAVLLGTAGGIFICAVQLVIKQANSGKSAGVLNSAADYTALWSIGFGFGPLLAALGDSPKVGYLWVFIVVGMIFFGCIFLVSVLAKSLPPISAELAENKLEKGNLPDLIILGWIIGGVCCFAFGAVRGYLQCKCDFYGIPPFWRGVSLWSLGISQGLVGLATIKLRKNWQYDFRHAIFFVLCGLVGSLVLFVATTMPTILLGTVLFGMFSGAIYVFFVFHAMIDPAKAPRYIGINEMLSGSLSMSGAFASGFAGLLFVDLPFLMLAAIFLVLGIALIAMRRRFVS